jgi:hypothetical protein
VAESRSELLHLLFLLSSSSTLTFTGYYWYTDSQQVQDLDSFWIRLTIPKNWVRSSCTSAVRRKGISKGKFHSINFTVSYSCWIRNILQGDLGAGKRKLGPGLSLAVRDWDESESPPTYLLSNAHQTGSNNLE